MPHPDPSSLTPQPMPRVRRGVTLIETLVALSTGLLLIAPAIVLRQDQVDTERQIQDATRVRGIHQSLVLFGTTNNDAYPRPSVLDAANHTVALAGGAAPQTKDHSAAIYSVLVFNSYVPAEFLVSPAEVSTQIVVDEDYALVEPPTAANPGQALWDPAFTADFTDGKTGNTSFAHAIPAEDRHNRWTMTLKADEAIVSTRGPRISSVTRTQNEQGNEVLDVTYSTMQTKTLDFFTPEPPQSPGEGSVSETDLPQSPTAWRGNVAFNDNHVTFYTDVHDTNVTYPLDKLMGEPGPSKARDVFFYDEPDAREKNNAYLSIFTLGSATSSGYRAIWD